MTFSLIKYNSGIVKDTTEYSAGKNGPFYVDSDLVRFVNVTQRKLVAGKKMRFMH